MSRNRTNSYAKYQLELGSYFNASVLQIIQDYGNMLDC